MIIGILMSINNKFITSILKLFGNLLSKRSFPILKGSKSYISNNRFSFFSVNAVLKENRQMFVYRYFPKLKVYIDIIIC